MCRGINSSRFDCKNEKSAQPTTIQYILCYTSNVNPAILSCALLHFFSPPPNDRLTSIQGEREREEREEREKGGGREPDEIPPGGTIRAGHHRRDHNHHRHVYSEDGSIRDQAKARL